jgi:hypothetical protein
MAGETTGGVTFTAASARVETARCGGKGIVPGATGARQIG